MVLNQLRRMILLFLKPIFKLVLIRNKNFNKIAYICKGNICRSVFAEFYSKKRFPKLYCESYGTLNLKNRQSPAKIKKAALSLKINLNNHRSSIFKANKIKKGTLIMCFDLDNYCSILKTDMRLIKNTVLLSIYGEKLYEIEDPYRKPIKEVIDNFKQIKYYIDKIKRVKN